jgi:hypothetical protein
MLRKMNSADRVARATAMLRRARKLNTPEARAEADITLGSLSRIELKEALMRAEGAEQPESQKNLTR